MNAHSRFFIGLDLGTSGCKAIAFDLDGTRLATGRVDYASSVHGDGAVRQDPNIWWDAAQSSISQVNARLGSGCAGIGVSAQIGTHVLLDKNAEPVVDAWTWQDGRAASVLGELGELLDPATLADDLQTWLPGGAAWPLPRLTWLRNTHPELLERAVYFAQPKDFLLHRLTGTLVSDPSSLRGLVHPDGFVHPTALDVIGVEINLPEIRPATSIAGTVEGKVADRLGLRAGTPVYVGWNDFNCALVGTGAAAEGDAFDIGGTSEHIGVLTRTPRIREMVTTVRYDAGDVSDIFVHYGVTSNGGSVTAWLRRMYSADHAVDIDLEAEARLAPVGSDGLLCLPYLHGERSPVWDADATGAYVGVRATHGRGHFIRSALEGVAYNLRQIYENAAPELPQGPIRASGGPTGMPLWNQIKADVLGHDIAVMQESDTAALGAAVLAAVGAGEFSRPAEAMNGMTRIAEVVSPDPVAHAVHDERYQRFREIYPALSGQHPTTKEYHFVK